MQGCSTGLSFSGRARTLLVTFLALALSACGGGGGGGSSGPSVPPPTPPKSISGVVMLGPVSDANIEVIGTSGSLATGVTAADGSFGPLTYDGDYNGPLRIRATAGETSTWICDFRLGCPVSGDFQPWGSSINFDGTLEAVLPVANNGQFVSVSMLSNFAAVRMDTIGALTTTNVNAANADIVALFEPAYGFLLDELSVTLPDNFATIELFDLQNLPAPGGSNDALSLLLSLINSSLAGLSSPLNTTGGFITQFSNQVAALSSLAVAGQTFSEPSLDSLILVMVAQLFEIRDSNEPPLETINALLSPANLSALTTSIFDAYIALPSLSPGNDIFEFVDDAALQSPIVRDVPIFTSTGQQLNASDVAANIVSFEAPTTSPWFTARPVVINGQLNIRIEFDNQQIATFANGIYSLGVGVRSVSGEFRRATIDVSMDLFRVGTQASAGNDITADERSTIILNGSTTSPNEVDIVSWSQVDGPTVVVTGGDTLQPSAELPSVDEDAVVTMQLDVSFTTGEQRVDTMLIFIRAFPNISDVSLPDAALQQCVDDAATVGGLIEVVELTSLACTGVSDVSGLDAFDNLSSLNLSDNSLTSLQAILGLANLEFVDLRGNPTLRCDEIDQLAERLTEGTDLLVDDACRGAFALDLGANGFDAILDEARGQIYVSVPTRSEIVVISTADLRIVDRLLVPGAPFGIDLSIDGARIFAALNNSNSVAIIDIAQRSVSAIDLGNFAGDPRTWDVVEGAPDRLFVSANPGSNGFAYIVQVLLDQGNITSRAAGEAIIRARPTFARSPDQNFVYVGSGFSPNSLYKLSLLDPAAPIVLEDDHGSVGGTDNLALNQSGTRIALSSGQVLRTGSFIEEGRVSSGRSIGSTLADTLFVAGPAGQIESFDFTTLAQTETLETGCDNSTSTRILAYDSDDAFMLLQASEACLYASVSRSTPPDPFASLRFPDLALEECVIDTAIAMGYTEPSEFTTLDCSTTSRTILSLESIDRLTNLENLNISNSGVIDLSSLAAMTSLQTLVAQDANISEISPLSGIASLVSADLTGNEGVLCADLDQLAAGGVSVIANSCTDTVRIELGGIGQDMAFDLADNRTFVSIPSLNRISEIDLGAATIDQNFTLSGQPYGIDLSMDGQTVYAALNGLGDVAVLDTTTGNSENIDISVELDDDRTWDVAEVSMNRIVVSTNPGGNGFGYVVEVRRDLGNAATRVADQTIIRASPVFRVSPDRSSVFVGVGFSPNTLYKLDATQAALPIARENEFGVVSGTFSLALNPDGSRIYTGSGQALSTETLSRVAQFPAGRSTVSADGSKLLVGDANSDSARVYDTSTTGQVGSLQWGCNIQNLAAIEEFGNGILVLGDDLVCFSRTVPYP